MSSNSTKRFIPRKAARQVIKDPVVTPAAPAPGPGGPPSMMTVVQLPPAFAGANCVAPLICRQTKADSLAHCWLGRTYAFSGEPPESYAWLGPVRSFALQGTLQGLTIGPVMNNPLPQPGGASPELDTLQVKLEGIDRLMPEVTDFDSLDNTTLLFAGREIMSVASAKLLDGVYTLTALRSRFGTHDVHEIGEPVWIAQRARLKVFSHQFFAAGNTAKFKITIGRQPLANAIPIEVKL